MNYSPFAVHYLPRAYLLSNWESVPLARLPQTARPFSMATCGLRCVRIPSAAPTSGLQGHVPCALRSPQPAPAPTRPCVSTQLPLKVGRLADAGPDRKSSLCSLGRADCLAISGPC